MDTTNVKAFDFNFQNVNVLRKDQSKKSIEKKRHLSMRLKMIQTILEYQSP